MIVRYYKDINKRSKTKEKGLTLSQAQHHCGLETTHKKDKAGNIIWFDSYTKM